MPALRLQRILSWSGLASRREAERMLLEGRIVEVGPVEEFFENPRDPRTRAFVRGEFAY